MSSKWLAQLPLPINCSLINMLNDRILIALCGLLVINKAITSIAFLTSGGSSVSQNKLLQLILGYIYTSHEK